jgi:MFS family permease
VFPLFLVIELKEPAYVYGLLLALSYGVGSAFSLFGGRLGDTHGKKTIALIGNLLIPLMSISVLFPSLILLGALFVFGWWAMYFRTPVRRVWLVEVSNPSYRSKVFGFLHAPDIGGGIIAVGYSVVFALIGIPIRWIIPVTSLPITVSSLCLALAHTQPNVEYVQSQSAHPMHEHESAEEEWHVSNDLVFRPLLLSATLFGFSYYTLGFPIVTVAQSQVSQVNNLMVTEEVEVYSLKSRYPTLRNHSFQVQQTGEQ